LGEEGGWGRLESVLIALSGIAIVVLVVFLVAPAARVSSPYMDAALSASWARVEPPILEAPPLDSLTLISRILLASTLLTAAGLLLYLRVRPGLGVLAGLGFLLSLQLVLAHGVLRTLTVDVLPALSASQTLSGPGWLFVYEKPQVEPTLIAGSYWILLPGAAIIFMASLAVALRAEREEAIRALAVLLLAIAATVPAGATVYTSRGATGAPSLDTPLVWYEDPGTPRVNVTLDAMGSQAWVEAEPRNLALAVLDHNTSAGVVVQRSFVPGLDIEGTPTYVNFTWTVQGYRFVEDPNGAGLILGELRFTYTRRSGTESAWIYAYIEPGSNDTIRLGYVKENLRSGICENVTIPEWGVNISIVAYLGVERFDPIYVYVNGVQVCRIRLIIPEARLTGIAFDAGRYDYTNTYELYLDNINLTIRTSLGERITVYDDFDDGVDDVFGPVHGAYWWHDTYYTGPAGSSPNPPPDGSVGLAILAVENIEHLYIATRLPDGTTMPGWSEAAWARCTGTASAETIAVRVEDTTGTDRSMVWVNITLNQSNFQGWSLLSPDGSDIYFTLPNGTTTQHYIQHIDVAAQTLTLQVLVPTLPAGSAAYVLMHYGGTPPYNTQAPTQPAPAGGLEYTVTRPLQPVYALNMIGNGDNWTVNETIIAGATPVFSPSSIVNLTVTAGATPNLSKLTLFAALPPGSGKTCQASFWNVFQPTTSPGITVAINHTTTFQAGVLRVTQTP